MSLTVKHLNADSSFLLIFSPELNALPSDFTSAAGTGAFSVLIDPWLTGPSIITAPWFAKTERKIPSAIQHLSEIEEPDVVIVSQNKPDHCHKETLLQLRPEAKTIIAAEPGAAKAIKSWNHFDPTRVHGLLKYDPKVKFGRSLRLRIPHLSSDGFPGELNVTFIPAKYYMTGLHNAIGITYQPPTVSKSVAPVALVDLPKSTKYFHMPLSPMTMPPSSPPLPMSPLVNRPMSFDQPTREPDAMQHPQYPPIQTHRPQLSRSSNTGSSEFLAATERPVIQVNSKTGPERGEIITRNLTLPDRSGQMDESPVLLDVKSSRWTFINNLPTPPDSPLPPTGGSSTNSSPNPSVVMSPTSKSFHRTSSTAPSHQKSLSSVSSMPNLSPITPARPKAISIIYSPHGLPLADLKPYIENHLVRIPGALPLTMLLHSFDHAQNPWFLGGNIMRGMYGGAEIARSLMARCWISAHDEEKDDRGISVKGLKVKRVTAEEVRKHLGEGEHGQWLKKRGWSCDVRSLDPGKDLVVRPPAKEVREAWCAGDREEKRLVEGEVEGNQI